MTAPVVWLLVGLVCVLGVLASAACRANAAAGFFVIAAGCAFVVSALTSAILAVAS